MIAWLLVLALLGAPSSVPSREDAVEIRAGTKAEFASAGACARLLSSRDVFVRALSPFDRSARLKTDRDVNEAEYLAFVAAQARDWTAEEKARLTAILQSFRTKTESLDLRLPSRVFLLKTTGLEEGMAAYCRGASIVIPAKLASADPARLERLIFHELFHVHRTHSPENRRALYRIIGFDVCPEIVLPEELRARKITNPDAPLLDAFIRVRVGGISVAATPVLLARTERYDVKRGGEFFENMDLKLLALDEVDGRLQPSRLPGGKPRLIDIAEATDYADQIGKNTQYIIHPEEILADNFVLMLDGGSSAPTPRILREMRSVLTKQPRGRPTRSSQSPARPG